MKCIVQIGNLELCCVTQFLYILYTDKCTQHLSLVSGLLEQQRTCDALLLEFGGVCGED